MNFDETPEFKKDVKAFGKRVPTLKNDVERVKPKLEALYVKPEGLDEEQWVEYKNNFFDNKRATKLKGYPPGLDVIKLRLDTDTLQYSGKLRLVCVMVVDANDMRLVEIYSKNDKVRENSARIKKYLS